MYTAVNKFLKEIMRLIKKIWLMCGEEINHNNLVVILTALAIFAGFWQINTIQVKIDTLQSSIKDIYSHYNRETFCKEISFEKNL